MIFVERIENHKLINTTPFREVANSLGWTIVKDTFEFERAYDGSLWETGYAPKKPECLDIEKEITEIDSLKLKLQQTDYIDNKLIEALVRNDGSLDVLKEKYAETLVNRQQYRDRIKELETTIANKEPIYRCYYAETGNGNIYAYTTADSTTICCSSTDASTPVSDRGELHQSDDLRLVGITVDHLFFKCAGEQYKAVRDRSKDIR